MTPLRLPTSSDESKIMTSDPDFETAAAGECDIAAFAARSDIDCGEPAGVVIGG